MQRKHFGTIFVAVFMVGFGLGGCQTVPAKKAVVVPVAVVQNTKVTPEHSAPKKAPSLFEAPQAGRIFSHYLSATVAERRGDIVSAGQHYLRAMRADPSNLFLQDRAFSLLLASGRYTQAVEVAKSIVASDATQPLVQMLLTFDDAITGKHDLALERLETMRQNAPNLIQFELIKQYIELAKGAPLEDVIRNLEAFEVGAGMVVYKYYHLGRLHLRLGDVDAAIQAFRHGRLVNPGSLFITTALGRVLQSVGQFAEAKKTYESFLDLNPDSLLIDASMREVEAEKVAVFPVQSIEDDLAEVMYGLASMMIGREVNITARQFLHLALMAKGDHQLAMFMLGLVEEQDGQFERALSYYRKIKPGTTPYLSGSVRAAEILFKQGQHDEAIAAFNSLIKNNAHVTLLHRPLAQLYYDIGKYNKATEQYTFLIKAIGKHASRRHAPLFFARGAAYERLKDYDNAALDLEMSLVLEPQNPVVLNYLGYMWLDRGQNLDKAYTYIRQAAELRPHDGAIIDSLGWVYYKKGQFETAIRYLEKAVSLLPNDPVIHLHLGQAYQKAGRVAEAKVRWQRALELEPENPADLKTLQNLLERAQ